jgi:hypothetical protein
MSQSDEDVDVPDVQADGLAGAATPTRTDAADFGEHKLHFRLGHGTGQACLAWLPPAKPGAEAAGDSAHEAPQLLTCGGDGRIVLRDGDSLDEITVFTNKGGAVHSVAASPKGTVLAFGDHQWCKVRLCSCSHASVQPPS